MSTTDSVQLLRAYAERGDEAAFRELVAAYIDLVYSTALRRVGHDAELARDVTQTVFTDLARKARSLRGEVMLGGWLHRHTGFVAATVVRSERRRQAREQQAAEMNALQDSPDSIWQQLAPCLDETIDALEAPDRQAIVLRFFERRDFNSIGAALGISDDAAQKRVSRALEKLRAMLAQRGVTLGVTLLAGLMAGKVVNAAPVGLATSVSREALATASIAGVTVTLTKLMSSLTFKLAVGTVAIVTVAILVSRPGVNRDQSFAPQRVGPTQTQTGLLATLKSNAQPVAADTVSSDTIAASNKLELHIVAADSGQPIPDAELLCQLQEGTEVRQTNLQGDRFGVCQIPVTRADATLLILQVQAEGFAEAWLHWRLDRGDTIPGDYTLRLKRAIRVGGQVVDADGQPVGGAVVAFSTVYVAQGLEEARPETHAIVLVQASTDAGGQWTLNRIARDNLRRTEVNAGHTNHVSSETIPLGNHAEAEQQLVAGTYVFRLGRAVSLRGLVTTPGGQPVPEAKLLFSPIAIGTDFGTTYRGSRPGDPRRSPRLSTNLLDGSFLLTGCAPVKSEIWIEAKGFVTTNFMVDLTSNSVPLRFVMTPGKILRLRILDQTGVPVPNARVGFNTGFQTSGSVPLTDPEGRIEWASAPEGEITVRDVLASGHRWRVDTEVKSDGQEHVITLPPTLIISGAVRDAASSQPIRNFRIIPGKLQQGPRPGTTNTSWYGVRKPWVDAIQGEFRQMVEPAMALDDIWVFKFEADGYAPFITRAVRGDEREVSFNISLQLATIATVAVVLPNGQPAVGADVGLVSPNAPLNLLPGGLDRSILPNNSRLLMADESGRFRLQVDPEVTRIVVAHPEGYAEATPTELVANPTIHLQPWGRIEGHLLSGGRGVANRSVRLNYGTNASSSITSYIGPVQGRPNLESFQAITDENGRFILAKVPPGRHRLVLVQANPANRVTTIPGRGRGTLTRSIPIEDLDIRPGTTTTATALICQVAARLRWPENVQRQANWRVTVSLREIPGRQNPRGYSLSETAQGDFVAEDVLAGSYTLTATVTEPQTGGGPQRRLLRTQVAVAVPVDPTNGTLDLGEIVLQPAQ